MLPRSMNFRRLKHGRPNRTKKDGLLHGAPSAKRRGMLIIDDLTVRIAGRTLLKGASARIPTGARVGLVGRNGTGKTTLFGVITGDTSAEQGHVGASEDLRRRRRTDRRAFLRSY
jgi:ABC-type branched-subunit amino acid transport system ATPase component